ncbi:putative pectinesterase 63 [Vitis vinifera]|uniref:Pectinesterase n=3 Tax=Vitis vinifera TaxID=29760 RepID=A0A438DVK3_VITVI|eukprot:XP_002277388.2 PREDICTED: putative pectinesterase 63 [Vitis vinifera]
MATKMTHTAFPAAASMVFFFLVLPSTVLADDPQIPDDAIQLASWFNDVIQSHNLRRTTLDPVLVKAEERVKIIKVSKGGGGNFNKVMAAVDSVPAGNTQRVIIWIGGGVYEEKIKIDRSKPFITFYGSPDDMPMLSFDGTAAKFGTVDSATLIVESDYFMAVNIIVINSSPRPEGRRNGGQAVAVRVSGDKAAFYNCKLVGFQDTLCDDRGRHFFHGCYIEGTVDFIFGSGKSLYLSTELHAKGAGGEFSVITAQARKLESEDNGYSFVHCRVSGSGSNTYLGRAWMSRPRVVFSYTNMSTVVHPLGWSDNFHPERDSLVFYGEYKCMGPGANTSKRAKFAKMLDDDGVRPFVTLNYIEASKWLLPPPRLVPRGKRYELVYSKWMMTRYSVQNNILV